VEKSPENFVDGMTDRQTDGQTDRQMGIKPIVPSGYTGRGLINGYLSSSPTLSSSSSVDDSALSSASSSIIANLKHRQFCETFIHMVCCLTLVKVTADIQEFLKRHRIFSILCMLKNFEYW
jgi:hypothetical protein